MAYWLRVQEEGDQGISERKGKNLGVPFYRNKFEWQRGRRKLRREAAL